MLDGFDYRTTVFHSGSSLEQVFAIYGNVLHVDADGMVLNDGDAQYRVAQWIRACCDPSYRVEPPLPRRHRRRRGPQAPDPLTKDTVRIDLDTAAAEAGVPANAPDYARTFEDAPAASPPSCAVAFRALGDATAPLGPLRLSAFAAQLAVRSAITSPDPYARFVSGPATISTSSSRVMSATAGRAGGAASVANSSRLLLP
ncbi:hypothetical protein [Streptomyces sp. NPDC058745]|uniref:DUF7677 family protein n=1 Tax=unclassified Streptomyces TaxID=2593676 RepID=UPI003677ABB0